MLLLAAVAPVPGQDPGVPEIRGLRLYGRSRADLPVAFIRREPMTIEFDIKAGHPPDLELRFFHYDRNWNLTQTGFVNDEFHNRTRIELPFEFAPVGVKGYTYHYSFQIPDERLFGVFLFSGNYEVEIWDTDSDELLGRSRFFVSDTILRPRMKVDNRQEPSAMNPYYQVNQVEVAFTIPSPDTADGQSYFPLDFNAVDVYRNRELYRPRRIDTDDRDPQTFVEGFSTHSMVFRIDNILPGNEYRLLDLRNTDFYPQDRPIRSRDGADLSRFPGRPARDNNGASFLVDGSRYAEYLDFEFELLWDTSEEPVFVVGDFNRWMPDRGGPMRFENGRYRWRTTLRRGRYDYQYVVGDDWIVLEGNDWRTVNQYTALVYYRDPRFGGFDRILGVVKGQSPGGTSVTAH